MISSRMMAVNLLVLQSVPCGFSIEKSRGRGCCPIYRATLVLRLKFTTKVLFMRYSRKSLNIEGLGEINQKLR